MLAAQLSGKLTREEEDLEDLLTSNVFGSIKYVPHEEGLIPLLSAAERLDGSQPLNYGLSEISEVKYYFWHRIEKQNCYACEPDVLICIKHNDDKKTVVLVEAKYRSGKSSEEEEDDRPTDQLAREWDNLIVLAKEKAATPYLLYVTADIAIPSIDIEESQSEIAKKRGAKIDIVWISWRKLPIIFRDSRYDILRDLVEVLRRQWLIFFEGISAPENMEAINWHFQSTPLKLNLSFDAPVFQWKYNNKVSLRFDWISFVFLKMKWRFKK